jgi:hypothetical protein
MITARLRVAHSRTVDAVAGGLGLGDRSFLQEMRESASSLTKSAISNGAAALAIVQAENLVFVTHQRLASARSGAPLSIQFEGWNLGEALTRLARGEEEIIG